MKGRFWNLSWLLLTIILSSNTISGKSISTTSESVSEKVLRFFCVPELIFFFQIDYMKRFGYLGDPVSSSEALLTEEAVVYGLMKLQTFGGIPVTGNIDEATLKVICLSLLN